MPQSSTVDASTEATAGSPLERGLTVLRTLASAPGGRLRASELARATGLARSPVDRIATTLVHLGHLRAEDRDLVLAPRSMELSGAYLRAVALVDLLAPSSEALADELDESVSLAVPDVDAVRFIAQAARRRTLSVTFSAGDALPAEVCAPGALFAAEWGPEEYAVWRERRRDPDRSLLAVPPPPAVDLPAEEAALARRAAVAREQGWSVDDQFIEPGLVAVAVPVRDTAGRAVCALSVVSHTSRHSAASLRDAVLARMQRTAQQMAQALAAGAPGASSDPAPAQQRDTSLDPKAELGPSYLQSLARGLSVLAALGSAGGGMTLSEVARTTALPRATARRALLTLQQVGYAAADEGLFVPRPRVLELGYSVLSRLTLGELAQPHLAALVGRIHESASVAVLDGDDIRYVARVAAGRIMSVNITVGTRFPAYATSMGRVLLAGLPGGERTARLGRITPRPLTGHTLTDPAELRAVLDRTAEAGYAMVNEELEEGLRSVAVPVRDRSGSVITAVNVSLHAGRTSAAEARATILPALRECAAAITADVALVSERTPIRIG
ncbi:IclR family transcriptional regulator C-terminal domain-containing protein [Streptomyces sp. NPDC051322]|uniref:IclR family transcriptional regulator domain-containing protein n=1 Tax=Streptomyces sp. NPDC051322 TaxID=3154645 RepID=UPI00344C0CC9